MYRLDNINLSCRYDLGSWLVSYICVTDPVVLLCNKPTCISVKHNLYFVKTNSYMFRLFKKSLSGCTITQKGVNLQRLVEIIHDYSVVKFTRFLHFCTARWWLPRKPKHVAVGYVTEYKLCLMDILLNLVGKHLVN